MIKIVSGVLQPNLAGVHSERAETQNGLTHLPFEALPLGAKGLATRSIEATRGSWPYYWEQEASNKKAIAIRLMSIL